MCDPWDATEGVPPIQPLHNVDSMASAPYSDLIIFLQQIASRSVDCEIPPSVGMTAFLLQERIRLSLGPNLGWWPVPGQHRHVVAERKQFLFDSLE